MYSFLRNWRRWLDEQGIDRTDDLNDDYDILFANSFKTAYEAIYRVKAERPDLRVIQRVDGSTRDYGRYDGSDTKQAQANMLADLTIFQSHYSRYSTMEKYKVIHQNGPIIYNPVDLKTFTPHGPTRNLPGNIRVCNASFSMNRLKGTWRIGPLAAANPDVDFILCGRYPDLPELPNIHHMGHLTHSELSDVMRSCTMHVHLAENDPCPNVITEALGSGLPVLYWNSGGSPELVEECGLPITMDNFRQQLDRILARREEMSGMARARAERMFNRDHIFTQYIEAIRSAERQPLPTPLDHIKLQLQGYPVIDPGDVVSDAVQSGRAFAYRVVGKVRSMVD